MGDRPTPRDLVWLYRARLWRDATLVDLDQFVYATPHEIVYAVPVGPACVALVQPVFLLGP